MNSLYSELVIELYERELSGFNVLMMDGVVEEVHEIVEGRNCLCV